MGALRLTALTLAVLSTPAQADDLARWQPHILEASRRFGIPQDWIERVMRAESAGQTINAGRPIRSRAGAIGLMQLMRPTWTEIRARLGLGHDPDDPRDNILAGAYYLRLMHDRFGYPGLFGAYNVGPTAYAHWLAGKRRVPSETIAYLGALSSIPPPVNEKSVLLPRITLGKATQSRSSLFAVRHDVP